MQHRFEVSEQLIRFQRYAIPSRCFGSVVDGANRRQNSFSGKQRSLLRVNLLGLLPGQIVPLSSHNTSGTKCVAGQ